jgi:hypothetical protein
MNQYIHSLSERIIGHFGEKALESGINEAPFLLILIVPDADSA